jgi:hypothetical protein
MRAPTPSPYPPARGGGVNENDLAPFPDGEAVEREGVGGGVVEEYRATLIDDLAGSFKIERSDRID